MGALMKAGSETVASITRTEIKRLQKILDSKKFSVSVGDDWRDDHVTCCDFVAKAPHIKDVPFSLWWIDARVMGWAEACGDSPKTRVKFKAYMADAIKNALEDLE
jgi:hypothetical protein